MTKQILAGSLLLLIGVSGAGCSGQAWKARWHIFQAENARGEAAKLKEKRAAFEKRIPYFAEACRHYLRAYEIDASVFTLIRIEEAADACWKGNLADEEAVFRMFEEQYSDAHPQETEYGDAGVGMVEMG